MCMLPGMDGLAVCRRIRSTSSVPIIMITAKDEDADRILGLDIGADDYIVKPFSPGKVMARIRAVLRRLPAQDGRETLVIGTLSIHLPSLSVTLNGQKLALTRKEVELLFTLLLVAFTLIVSILFNALMRRQTIQHHSKTMQRNAYAISQNLSEVFAPTRYEDSLDETRFIVRDDMLAPYLAMTEQITRCNVYLVDTQHNVTGYFDGILQTLSNPLLPAYIEQTIALGFTRLFTHRIHRLKHVALALAGGAYDTRTHTDREDIPPHLRPLPPHARHLAREHRPRPGHRTGNRQPSRHSHPCGESGGQRHDSRLSLSQGDIKRGRANALPQPGGSFF